MHKVEQALSLLFSRETVAEGFKPDKT